MLRGLAAGLVAVLTAGVLTPRVAEHRTIVLCRPFKHITTISRSGAHFVVRNDNFGGRRECLSNRNDWSNFKVRVSKANARGVESMAYPNIFRGCSWGVCSPGSGMPVRVSRLDWLTTSWYTSLHASGRWAATYDIWFNRTDRVSGQDNGAELMIWLNARSFPATNRAPVVWIDHTRWRVQRWVTDGPNGKKWNYIQFRRLRPVTHVRRLKLVPFIRFSRRFGWIRRSWWLTGVEAGFEIWRGGAGLATTLFWAGKPRR